MVKPPQPNSLTAAELVAHLGGRLLGNGSFVVRRFSALDEAGPDEAAFVVHDRLKDRLRQSRAGLVLIPPGLEGSRPKAGSAIVTDDPYLYFARAAQMLLARQRVQEVLITQIHPSAVVHEQARLGMRLRIGAGVVIEAGAQIGDDCDIGAQTVVESGAQIGRGALIHARVFVGRSVQIGERVVIQSGAVIGSDGFGFAPTPAQTWEKIPQTGSVRIGHDVEIGANTVIDRGTLSDTVLGDGVKLDNLIQVAHNVFIGDHTAIAGCVGIAGSARIGRYCQIGGAAGILGHLQIADHTVIGPMSLVMSSIRESGKYVGVYPLQTEGEWEKSAVMVRRLPSLRDQVRALRKTNETS